MNVHTAGIQQPWRCMWGLWHNANVHSRCCPQGEDNQVYCPQQQLDSAENPPPQTAPNSFRKSQYHRHHHFFMCFHISRQGNVPPHPSPGSMALALDPGLGCVPGVRSLRAGNLDRVCLSLFLLLQENTQD